MKLTVWIASAVLALAGMAAAQAPAGNTKGKAKAKGPAQSPASRPVPPTVTPQTYSMAQIQNGAQRFAGQCGFCHGRDAAGGEGGPDLTRSLLVAEDNKGDKLGPLIAAGRPDQGMPAFKLSNADRDAIVAFIHDQKTKLEAVGGDRRSVDAADLLTGNADAGRTYFTAQCARCHSASGQSAGGDLAGIGTRFQGLALLQRLLYPSGGRPAPARPKATITLASGQVVTGPVATDDEFTIAITDAAGARQAYSKTDVKFTVDNPMSAHFDQLAKYTDKDMHDVYAFLAALK
jgi:cytochrome c oxidase cbb3-type subunit 3